SLPSARQVSSDRNAVSAAAVQGTLTKIDIPSPTATSLSPSSDVFSMLFFTFAGIIVLLLLHVTRVQLYLGVLFLQSHAAPFFFFASLGVMAETLFGFCPGFTLNFLYEPLSFFVSMLLPDFDADGYGPFTGILIGELQGNFASMIFLPSTVSGMQSLPPTFALGEASIPPFTA